MTLADFREQGAHIQLVQNNLAQKEVNVTDETRGQWPYTLASNTAMKMVQDLKPTTSITLASICTACMALVASK